MTTTTLTQHRPRLVPQAGPAAWQATELAPSDWMIPIGAEDAAELEAAIAALGPRRPIGAEEVPLPRLAPLLADLRARLEHGRGFALLRGVPLDRIAAAEGAAEALLLALGVHLGTPLPEEEGGPVTLMASPPPPPPTAAGEGGARPSPRFHAEPCDAVALLCLRHPPGPGASVLVSAAAVHNALMKRDRALLEELYRPLPGAGGGGPRPVFATTGGAFSARYDREATESAAAEPLTDRQRAALDLLDAVCVEPGLPLAIDTRPGDLLCFSPHLVWKRRTLVAAAPGAPETAREFMRLRLLTESSRAAPASPVQGG